MGMETMAVKYRPNLDELRKRYAHPDIIELLIRAHVPAWADGVDYHTLEQLPTEDANDDIKSLSSDMAWRLRSIDGLVDHVLTIEFRSEPEPDMPLQVTVSNSLAADRLFREDEELRSGRRRLALASLVIYNGDKPWNAPTRMGDLFENSMPDGYHVISPRPPDTPPPTALDLPQVLLGFGAAREPERIAHELRTLADATKACGDEDLARYLVEPVRDALMEKGVSSEQLGEATDVETMAVEYRRSLDDLRERETRTQH